MNEIHETYRQGRYQIEIVDDEDPQDPRYWDNLGTMLCYHRNYRLGDRKQSEQWNPHDYENWKEMAEAIDKAEDVFVMLPLSLYDHSGILVYVGNRAHFTDPGGWDSMYLGFIYITKKKAQEEYGELTEELATRIEKYLRNEVEIYNQYLSGQVYGYRIYRDKQEIDSCYGFYGEDDAMNEAKGVMQHCISEDKRFHFLKLKSWIFNKVPLQYRQPLLQ